MDKIFFIGMNRTGTFSYYNFLINNNIKSIHQKKDKNNKKDYGYWYETSLDYFKDHQSFVTSFEHYYEKEVYVDFNFLDINFPNSKFILNTRNLDDWLLSRLNHNKPSYYKSEKKNLDEIDLLRWCNYRNNHYKNIYDYFKNKELLILNISDINKTEKLKYFLNINTNITIDHYHDTSKIKNFQVINQKNKTIVNNFLKKYIIEEDWKSDGIIRFKI